MDKDDAIALYGSVTRLADALGISSQAVSMWPDDKPIPEVHRLRLRYELRPEAFEKANERGAA
jgi:hypothetical protein